MFKSGFVTIIGRPNVGKSTFLNTTIGQKIAIMSNKPQTTRNTISGILTLEDSQIVFIDTPGIHKSKSELGKRMTDAAYNAIMGVDAVMLMVTPGQTVTEIDEEMLDSLRNTRRPKYLIVNKIDIAKSKKDIEKTISEYSEGIEYQGVFTISAKENTNIDLLLEGIKKVLPEGPKYYPDTMVTDHPERFIVSEIIREKILNHTEEEVPHSVAVVVENMQKSLEEEDCVDIEVIIYVERQGQKAILIGKGGEKMKRIKQEAKREIKKILGSNVYLDLWVKVKDDWRNRSGYLKALGYGEDNM